MSSIRIQSSKNIMVTSGLQFDDVTNPDAHIPDRLKVSATWPKHSIMVKEGVDFYPEEIAQWATVQALVKSGVFTISKEDKKEAKEEDIEKIKELPSKKNRKKEKSLDELAGD